MIIINKNVTFFSGLFYHFIDTYGPRGKPYDACSLFWASLYALLNIASMVFVGALFTVALGCAMMWAVWMVLNGQWIDPYGWSVAGLAVLVIALVLLAIILAVVAIDEASVRMKSKSERVPYEQRSTLYKLWVGFKGRFCVAVDYK